MDSVIICLLWQYSVWKNSRAFCFVSYSFNQHLRLILNPFVQTKAIQGVYEKYGKQSEEVVADSGYGNEQNYAYMEGEGMEAYVKYPMFHAEMKRKYVKNAFLPQNMYYNAERDFYVCPMGQHLERCGTRTSVSDLGYRSVLSVYRAVNCTGCPLRGECYKSKSDRRTIEVNHRVNSFKRQARELLTRGVWRTGVPALLNLKRCSGTSSSTTASSGSVSGRTGK